MINKIMLVAITAIALSVGTSYGSAAINWETPGVFLGNSNPDIVDQFGTPIPTSSTWLVQLLRTSDNTVIAQNGATAWSDPGNAGQFYQQVNLADTTYDNTAVYTKIWNASTVLAATYFVNTGATTLTWADGGPASPPAQVDYVFGPVVAAQWVAVPEPSTFALLAAGLAVIGLRRKMRA